MKICGYRYRRLKVNKSQIAVPAVDMPTLFLDTHPWISIGNYLIEAGIWYLILYIIYPKKIWYGFYFLPVLLVIILSVTYNYLVFMRLSCIVP